MCNHFCQNFAKNNKKLQKILNLLTEFCKKKKSRNFDKIGIAELCKGVHCVDLGESFQTHIYLQNAASIQPRTSPLKFGILILSPPAKIKMKI